MLISTQYFNEYLSMRDEHYEVTVEDSQWSISILSIFLNELPNDYIIKNYFEVKESYNKLTVTNKSNQKQYIIIHITNGLKISTKFSKDFIISNFETFQQLFFVTHDNRNREYKIPRYKILTKYTYQISARKLSSKALSSNSSLLFFNKGDFSEPFIYFASKIKKLCEFSQTNDFIVNFCNTFINIKKIDSITNLKKLQLETEGTLYLKIVDHKEGDPFFKIEYQNDDKSIFSGVYISPYFSSVLIENRDLIDGIMMDTTWKVIPNYVTCILIAESHGTGIPIGFVFGKSEDKYLYQQMYDISDEMGIDLRLFIVESDQGSALRSVCCNNVLHLVCLKHFITSISKQTFGWELENLIKAKTTKELNILIDCYSDIIREMDNDKKKQAIKTLNKAGLTYSGAIEIQNHARWAQVSLERRIELSNMPSTTNSLESLHGHLNESLPRRNNFWASLFRLIKLCSIDKTYLQKKIKHNFNRAKYNSVCRLKALSDEEMNDECIYYNTTVDQCECTEQLINSKLHRIPILCSHRISKGAIQHDFVDVDFNFTKNKEGTLDIKYINIPRATVDPKYDPETMTFYEKLAVANIKRYVGVVDKEEIKEYVHRNISYSRERVNNMPLSV